MRQVLLWLRGGAYLDSDVVSKAPTPDRDFVAAQNENTINNAVMRFGRPRSPFLELCMRELVMKLTF